MLKHPHKNDTVEILEELHETVSACNKKDSITSNVVLPEIEKERERLHRARERLLHRAHEKLLRRARWFKEGKPDFFTELPEDMFNAIFSWIPDLKTHKAFILTCKAHYEKWKKKVIFQARCLSEGLKISWWHNPYYQDLYQNKDTILSFMVASYWGICFEMYHNRLKPAEFWNITRGVHAKELFPFSDEKSLPSIRDYKSEAPHRHRIFGFFKINLTVKELHQNTIEKVMTKETHYVMRTDFFSKDVTQIEAYITTEFKKYINPFFKHF